MALRCVYVHSFLPVCFCIIPDENVEVFTASYHEHGLLVFPKLHYVEDHMVPFIRKWKVGPGLLGEHGGKSVHAQFNSLNRRYHAIPDQQKRLQQMLKWHCLQASPVKKKNPRAMAQ